MLLFEIQSYNTQLCIFYIGELGYKNYNEEEIINNPNNTSDNTVINQLFHEIPVNYINLILFN